MEDRTIRQYQPIWEQIKKTGTATLIAPVTSYARVIQAVHKEKWRDTGWKLLTSEAGVHYTLESSIEVHTGAVSGIVTFKLVGKQLGITKITIKDL